MAMAVRALLVPVLIIGYCLRPMLAGCLQSLDRDVQISHGAKLDVQPLQFIPYPLPLGVIEHRREKRYGCAQAGKRDAHLMQGSGIASACRLMICGQIFKTAARYDSKCGIARHCWIQSRGWVGALPLRGHGPRGGFASWVRGWRHCCFVCSKWSCHAPLDLGFEDCGTQNLSRPQLCKHLVGFSKRECRRPGPDSSLRGNFEEIQPVLAREVGNRHQLSFLPKKIVGK